MFLLVRLRLRERPHTLSDEKARERELQLFRHDYVSLARRLVNMMVRGVVAILTAIGGVVVLSVLLDALVKIRTARDTYTEVLRKAIEAKVEGKEFELPREERRRPVANLMKALEASLARKEPAKAAGRAAAKSPQKRRAGKPAA